MTAETSGCLYDTGRDRWTHGALTYASWWGAGDELLGPCPHCGSRTRSYGGGWACLASYCQASPSVFAVSAGSAPWWWEGKVRVYLDGNAWCATFPDFINLQESLAGFGTTPAEAVRALLAAKGQA